MEDISEMINLGWRVYELSLYHRVMHLKQVRLYRYPTLVFVKDKPNKYEL
jgi:hypothetical protein